MRRYAAIVVAALLAACATGLAQQATATNLPEKLAMEAQAKLADHAGRIAKLRESSDATVKLYLPTAEYLLASLRNYLNPKAWEAANGRPFLSKATLARLGKTGLPRRVKALMDELDIVVPALEAGRNPYIKHAGSTLVAYRSPLDGRLLAMRVTIPVRYDPGKRYKLRIENSSSGGWSGGQMKPSWVRHSATINFFSAIISDRGECHYGNDLHEAETLEAIAALQKLFSIDPSRIYKSGGSKDGYTSVTIGMHYPHLFSAIVGIAINSLPDGFINSRNLPCFAPGREQMNAYLQAENLYSLPAALVTGFDGDHTNPLLMGALLEKIGAPAKIIRVEPEAGHSETRWTRAEVAKWLTKQSLNPYPKRVYVSTNSLRYNRFYWVQVDALERQNHFARMRVDVLEGNRIEVEARNVERFTLETLDKLIDASGPVTVEINDIPLGEMKVSDNRLVFAKRGGKWASVAGSRGGLVKKHGLSGPVMDGWIQPAVHVIGTLGGVA